MPIPHISLEKIINYCGRSVAKNGLEYLDSDAFYIFFKEWLCLKALCQGSKDAGYPVKVHFNRHGIVNSSCACKNNINGPCKHIAAILLMWYKTPEYFIEKNQWLKELSSKSKQELIDLINKIIDLYPEMSNTFDTQIGQS